MNTHVSLNEFELQIEEAGKNLLQDLPCSADELLIRLNKLEDLLIKVGQAPPESMQDALLPSLKALISDEIFLYSDEKVNISVISCIHEITRITAPDAPYNDEQMKAIFGKTVEAFKRLADESGFFYAKAVSILDNVARVRSCLMMLDLECDVAVVEMFHHFLKVIRPNHPHNVFLSIEAILIMIIEESEEISMDLLRPLLDSVRKDNETSSHISWTLGEKVLKKCAAKLKPYVKKGVESKAIHLEELAEIVISIYQNEPEAIRHDDLNGSGEKHEEEKADMKKDVNYPSLDETEVLASIAASPRSVSKIADGTGTLEIGDDNCPTPNNKTHQKEKLKPLKKESSPKQQSACSRKNLKSNDGARRNSEANDLELVNEVKPDIEPDSVPRKRGRKPNSLMNPEEGYDNTWICGGRKVAKSSQKRKSSDKDVDCSPTDNCASQKVSVPPKPEKVSEASVSQPEPSKDGDAVSSVSRSQAPPDGSQRKRGRPKKNSKVNQNASPDSLSESRKKSLVEKLGNTPIPASECLITDLHNSKENSRKTVVAVETDEKTNLSSADVDENKSQVQKVATRKAKVGINLKKVLAEASATENEITQTTPRSSHGDESLVLATPKTEIKRKVNAVKVETPVTAEPGEQLVGRRVKVWWPMDKIFYEGVIDSYDPAKKKHKVLYLDGDQESLNLRKQRWQLICDDVSSDSDQAINGQKQDTESVMPLKNKRKAMSEPSKKGSNFSSPKSSGRAVKSVKYSSKSVGNSALEKSLMDDDGSQDDPSQTCNDQKSAGKMKFKKAKVAVSKKESQG